MSFIFIIMLTSNNIAKNHRKALKEYMKNKMGNKPKTKLYIFAGLPATGKTTLAKKLAKKISAVYLRIDTIEQGLRDLFLKNIEGEGYRLAYRIASDNLIAGNSVIADCCNPVKLTRDEWEKVANDNKTEFINIEIICSNKEKHYHQYKNRINDIKNLMLPDWVEILKREYQAWDKERIVIDTFDHTPDESFEELISQIT